MTNANLLGLNQADCEKIAEKLNVLLANYSIFYQNTRGAHWNVKGAQFFTLHEKYEELYTDMGAKIDEIAERILALGYTPVHKFTDYAQLSTIKESDNTHDGQKFTEEVLNSFKVIIELQRELLEITGDAGDEGTTGLISGYITEQEKEVWMYNAYLGK